MENHQAAPYSFNICSHQRDGRRVSYVIPGQLGCMAIDHGDKASPCHGGQAIRLSLVGCR